MSISPPQLTFYTELEKEPLETLFSEAGVVDQIVALNARISVGILDFSKERARVVRRLNARGIPLIAWQLLPKEQGYWFNLDNASVAAEQYRQFSEWTAREGLEWEAIGIDMEPHIDEFRELLTYNFRTLLSILKRPWTNTLLFEQSTMLYESLVSRMRSDGYSVHSYELFLMADERKTGSTLPSRLLGITHTPADMRVGMLYSSLFKPFGAALLKMYAKSFDSAAIGITGGGVELEGVEEKDPMTWDELSRDLRIARRACAEIHIFSLEGCVKQDYLRRLATFDWEKDVENTPGWTSVLFLARSIGSALLWLFDHPVPMLGVIAASVGLLLY